MLTAQPGHRHTNFGLPQDRKDLFIGAYAAPSGATVPSSSVYLPVFIRNLIVHLAEKSTYAAPCFRGDFQGKCVAPRPARRFASIALLVRSDADSS